MARQNENLSCAHCGQTPCEGVSKHRVCISCGKNLGEFPPGVAGTLEACQNGVCNVYKVFE
jgi:hypothetical protein